MPDEVVVTQPQPTPTEGALVEGPDWLTQEKFEGLRSGEIALESLEPKQREEFHGVMEKAMTGKSSPASTTSPAAPASNGTPAPAAAAPAAGEVKSPAEVPVSKPKDQQKFFEKHNQLVVESNRNKQLLDRANRERDTLKAKLAEIQKKPVTAANPDDGLDPLSVKNLVERLSKAEETITALTGHLESTSGLLQEEYSTRSSQLEADTLVMSLEKFQLETADPDFVPSSLSLKTTVPLMDLKAEIEGFATAIGGLQNVNRYLSDPNYKSQVEAQGHKLSEAFIANLPKYNTIFTLNQAVIEKKFPDHKVAYLAHLISTGKLKEWQAAAKLDGANAVANELSRRNTQTPLLSPGEGPRPAAAGWTLASARQWYIDHPDVKPGSPEADVKAQLSELIRSGQLR